ncbi:MAG: TlpA family protein disulfide reductase, partial [Anaerolineae bacterium]|nr:TlpA family protein disulfide reductase [Anaerolineae bacterium]
DVYKRQDHAELSGREGMNRLLFWGLIALSLITLATGLWLWQADRQRVAAQARPQAEAARPAPDFMLNTADGGQVRLRDLQGQVILLNFWATWCPPCKAEMPDLDALYRQYGAARGFIVIGIDAQEKPETVAAFARQNKITFPLALDADGAVTGGLYRVRAFPTSFIIDRTGQIRDSWTGQISREAMLMRLQRVW